MLGVLESDTADEETEMDADTLVKAIGPTALFLLVMAATHALTVLKNRHRPGKGPIIVVDWRTFKDAERRIEALAASGDHLAAYAGAIMVCHFLRDRAATGPARRKVRRARQAEYWELRRDQLREQTPLAAC